MFVLDTNVVSELRKVRSSKADPGVAQWAASVPSSYMFVSAITVHELEHGVLLAESSDPAKGAVLRRWLDDSFPEIPGDHAALSRVIRGQVFALVVEHLALGGVSTSAARERAEELATLVVP